MTFDGDVGRLVYDVLKGHLLHNVAVVYYGPAEEPLNIAVECEDCSMVLLDVNRPLQRAITAEGIVVEILAEDWQSEGECYPTAIKAKYPDGRVQWVGDDYVAFYTRSEEPTEDDFIEAFDVEEGKKLYAEYIASTDER
jgi:hypothetical protein